MSKKYDKMSQNELQTELENLKAKEVNLVVDVENKSIVGKTKIKKIKELNEVRLTINEVNKLLTNWLPSKELSSLEFVDIDDINAISKKEEEINKKLDSSNYKNELDEYLEEKANAQTDILVSTKQEILNSDVDEVEDLSIMCWSEEDRKREEELINRKIEVINSALKVTTNDNRKTELNKKAKQYKKNLSKIQSYNE